MSLIGNTTNMRIGQYQTDLLSILTIHVNRMTPLRKFKYLVNRKMQQLSFTKKIQNMLISMYTSNHVKRIAEITEILNILICKFDLYLDFPTKFKVVLKEKLVEFSNTGMGEMNGLYQYNVKFGFYCNHYIDKTNLFCINTVSNNRYCLFHNKQKQKTGIYVASTLNKFSVHNDLIKIIEEYIDY
jgi:hypothetical protein